MSEQSVGGEESTGDELDLTGIYYDFGLPFGQTSELGGVTFVSPEPFGDANMSSVGPSISIANTDWPDLYRREVWADGPLRYDVPADNGSYTVHLHFAEYANPNPGAMVLDAFVNEEEVATGVDLNAVGFQTAVMRSADVDITNGILSIEIRPADGTRYSKISGLEIVPVGAPSRLAPSAPDDTPPGGSCEATWATNVEVNLGIATWSKDKDAAVSITFDDNSPDQFTVAQPILDQRGLKATFYVTTNFTNADRWELIRRAADLNHEIGGHSVSHPALANVSDEQLDFELAESKRLIEEEVGQECLTLSWPYGSEDARTRRAARNLGYIGARGCNSSCQSEQSSEIGDANWDDFFYKINRRTLVPETSIRDYRGYLDNVVNSGNWLSFVYHGIARDGGGWKPISTDSFRAQMDEVVLRGDRLWVAPFRDVLRYFQERISAELAQLDSSTSRILLRLSDDLPDDVYTVPLTIRVSFVGANKVTKVFQGQEELAFEQDSDWIMFDAIPDGETIALSACDLVD